MDPRRNFRRGISGRGRESDACQYRQVQQIVAHICDGVVAEAGITKDSFIRGQFAVGSLNNEPDRQLRRSMRRRARCPC